MQETKSGVEPNITLLHTRHLRHHIAVNRMQVHESGGIMKKHQVHLSRSYLDAGTHVQVARMSPASAVVVWLDDRCTRSCVLVRQLVHQTVRCPKYRAEPWTAELAGRTSPSWSHFALIEVVASSESVSCLANLLPYLPAETLQQPPRCRLLSTNIQYINSRPFRNHHFKWRTFSLSLAGRLRRLG